MLEQLPVAVAIPVRRLDLTGGVEREVELVLTVWHEAVRRAARDYDVVVRPVRQRPERGLKDPPALVHEDDLVAFAVAIEVALLLRRAAQPDLNVVVEHQHAPA